MIIARYLMREITRPLAVILAVLAAVFASYSASGFLSDAANGLLPVSDILLLTWLKVAIALEVLIPASLYIAVILAFGRLQADSEFAAMNALRVTPLAMLRAAGTVAASLAIVAGGLSLFMRPFAYRQLHALTGRAVALLDVDAMVPGTFYVGRQGDRVILLGQRQGPHTPAQNVFVRIRHPGYTEVISARLAYTLPPTGTELDGPQIYLRDARIYRIGHTDGSAPSLVEAGGMVLQTQGEHVDAPTYSAVAASSAALAGSATPADIAELQWRLSTPISTLLLGLLGVPLSRIRPRQGRYANLAAAMVLYFGYYLLTTSARTWVQHGSIPAFPGIWWVCGLLALVLGAWIAQPELPGLLHRPRSGLRA